MGSSRRDPRPDDPTVPHRPAVTARDATDPSATDDLLAGRYALLEEIGSGASGSVYRARDTQLGEEVALKTLAPSADAPAAFERFREEVRLARRITHTNVARTFDLGDADGMPFITMELVRGESLRRRLRVRGALPAAEALLIAADLASGVAAAHTVSVIHRDLKPLNVMITPEGRVVVIDFGIAVLAGTTDAARAGTAAYMAPEQLEGATLTPAVDIWAIGVILFEMMAGVRPFGPAPPQLADDPRLAGPAPRLNSVVAVADAIDELVARCLSRAPDGRPSAAELAARARSLADDVTPARAGFPEAAPTALEPHVCTVAVLPFAAPPADAFVAACLAEDLVDTLARTHGTRVLAMAATRAIAAQPAAHEAAAELGADVAIEGRLERTRDGFTLHARLIDAHTGLVRMVEDASARIGAVLSLHEALALRVAEALRVGLSIERHGELPDAAVDAFLTARQEMRLLRAPNVKVLVDALDRCLALAPTFRPALALQAITTVRQWALRGGDADPGERARVAVERATRLAPDVAETWIADALYAEQRSDLERVRRSGERALAIAPTCAAAYVIRGRMAFEGGRIEDGARALRIAVDLDPATSPNLTMLARAAALRGRWDAYARTMARIALLGAGGSPEPLVMQVRAAAWRHDEDAMRRAIEVARAAAPRVSSLGAYVQAAADGDDSGLVEIADGAHPIAPRRRAFASQLLAELRAARDPAGALAQVENAVACGLVDRDWLELCPALAPLRADRRFAAAQATVAARAAAVTW